MTCVFQSTKQRNSFNPIISHSRLILTGGDIELNWLDVLPRLSSGICPVDRYNFANSGVHTFYLVNLGISEFPKSFQNPLFTDGQMTPNFVTHDMFTNFTTGVPMCIAHKAHLIGC